MRFLLTFMLLLTAAITTPATAQDDTLIIERATTLAAPQPMPSAGVFMLITNKSDKDDTLTGIRADIALEGMLHDTEFDDKGVMRMRHTPGIPVPAGKTVALTPVGSHGMLMDIAEPLEEGRQIPVTLVFEQAGEKTVNVEAVSLDEMSDRFPPELMSENLQKLREAQIAQDSGKKSWVAQMRSRIRALLGGTEESATAAPAPNHDAGEAAADEHEGHHETPQGPVSRPVGDALAPQDEPHAP